MRRALVGTLALLASAALAGAGADGHLLVGARFFREARFSEALIEFRVAQRLGSAGALWYAGASLQKLHRADEAIEAFSAADVQDPGGNDALLDYYRALACYDARLYLCADRLLSSVGDRSGPRIAGQVREARAQIAEALREGPSTSDIDWYHQRAGEAAAAGRASLATAVFEEARALAALRADRYRSAEADAALQRLRGGAP